MDEAQIMQLRLYLGILEERHKKAVDASETAAGLSTLVHRYEQGYSFALKKVIDELRNLIRGFAQQEEEALVEGIPIEEDTDEIPDN
jgi:hypothetical protein